MTREVACAVGGTCLFARAHASASKERGAQSTAGDRVEEACMRTQARERFNESFFAFEETREAGAEQRDSTTKHRAGRGSVQPGLKGCMLTFH